MADLKFRPLSDGLGFHPFSDGLPYAPPGKTPSHRPNQGSQAMSSGSGAVSAGRPTYNAPSGASSQGSHVWINVPVAHKPVPSAGVAPAPVPAPTLAPGTRIPALGYGYLFKRTLAFVLDSTLNLGICAATLSTVFLKKDFTMDAFFNPVVLVLSATFLGFCNWGSIAAQEVAFGTSFGKNIFGLSLKGSGASVFLRAVFFVPSFMFAGIGIFWALFDGEKRCWHDRASDLQPLETARL